MEYGARSKTWDSCSRFVLAIDLKDSEREREWEKIGAGLAASLIDRSFFREVLSGGLTDLVSKKLADR
jgi:hypothetical protein